jgi:hypothetical protein
MLKHIGQNDRVKGTDCAFGAQVTLRHNYDASPPRDFSRFSANFNTKPFVARSEGL